MTRELETSIAEILPHVVGLRHELHAHPQIRYEETFAGELIRRELSASGVEFAFPLAETGVVGWLMPRDAAARGRKAVALRADMDAIPVTEQTQLEYASQNPGVMHACGHDGHMAILLGTAKVLAGIRDSLPRPVKFLFQPAEENGAGADRMITDGALGAKVGGCEVGAIFAVHGIPDMPLGRVAARTGPSKAGVNNFRITVAGRGGHGAKPHLAADPVVAACQIIVALQSIVSRNVDPIDPAVVTVGSVHAGTGPNIIPPLAELEGTIRTFRDETAELIMRRIEEIAGRLAEGLGCRANAAFGDGYPVTVNAPLAVEYARKAAAFLGPDGVGESELCMWGEDFSFYGRVVPSCMIDLGCQPAGQEQPAALHSPTMDFNDDALPIGIRLFCELVLRAEELGID